MFKHFELHVTLIRANARTSALRDIICHFYSLVRILHIHRFTDWQCFQQNKRQEIQLANISRVIGSGKMDEPLR